MTGTFLTCASEVLVCQLLFKKQLFWGLNDVPGTYWLTHSWWHPNWGGGEGWGVLVAIPSP